MRIVFMGTPDFAVPCLEALLNAGYTVCGVVTQPDRPKGRKREMTPPPVKVIALANGIPVYQPESLKEQGAIEPIRAWQPDLIVTAAFGQILPVELLQLPVNRCINVHASLLPKYRGGAPIQHSIIDGESESGVTIMYMERGLDTGDMLAQSKVEITEFDDNGTMHQKLSLCGAQLLLDMLPKLLRGELHPVPQDHEKASYAKNISRADERINWNHTSSQIWNRVRGLHPWPIAFSMIQEEVFKIWQAEQIDDTSIEFSDVVPGTIIRCDETGIVVRTGDGVISLKVIQPAGKKAMPASEYVRGRHVQPGTIFQN
jgi:methionyl-tRNA formyltransferase